MTTDPAKTPGADLARTRYRAALGAVLVAGAFCLAVAAVLAVAGARQPAVEFSKSEDIARLRAALLKAPDADALKTIQEEIRGRDLALRQEFFRHQGFVRTGGYLLVGGLVVGLVAASRVARYRQRPPMPRPVTGRPKSAAAARLARWSVAATAVVLVAGGAALVALWGGALDGGSPPAAEDVKPAAPEKPFPTPDEIRKQWPRFRGPGGLGVSATTNFPATWNGKTGENILWKTPVPLPGENSPVVWGDRVFLTGATDAQREVYCFDAATGRLLWRKGVETPASAGADPPEVLEDTGFAAPTAATDGRYVAAIFANGDVACFDYEGKRLWARNLGPFKNSYGYASSLDMYRNTVLVLVDQGTPGKTRSSLLALDVVSGKTVWQTARPVPSSWATPILVAAGGREEFVAAGKPWVIAYDPAAGTELWRVKVLDGDVAPSPVWAGGLVFVGNAGSKLAAIRPGGQGDVTATHVAWTAEDGLPDIVSPLADGQVVLLVTTDGTLTAYAAADGKKCYEKEIDAIFKSSPTLVGDRIWLMSDKGLVFFLAAGPRYQELGKAELGEPSNSSPAFLNGRIYIHGMHNLYCIGAK